MNSVVVMICVCFTQILLFALIYIILPILIYIILAFSQNARNMPIWFTKPRIRRLCVSTLARIKYLVARLLRRLLSSVEFKQNPQNFRTWWEWTRWKCCWSDKKNIRLIANTTKKWIRKSSLIIESTIWYRKHLTYNCSIIQTVLYKILIYKLNNNLTNYKKRKIKIYFNNVWELHLIIFCE